MKRLSVAIAIIVTLTQAGSHSPRASGDWGSDATLKLAVAAHHSFVAGLVEVALKQYEQARILASKAGETRAVVRLLISSSACDLALFRYRTALAKLTEARDMTAHYGDCESQALISGNLSSIFLQMNDFANAKMHASEAVKLRQCISHPLTRAQLLLQLGWLYSLLGESKAAIPLFVQAVDETNSDPGSLLAESGLDRLGEELLRIGNLQAAEMALSASFRRRLLSHDPSLFITRFRLAALRLAQGDLNSARHLIDASMASASGARLPPYVLPHLRGRIRRAQGDLPGAVGDFREAIRLASKWRGQILPVDSVRSSADSGLHEIYDSFINAAVSLYNTTHDPSLLVEAWEVTEANRSASLRESSLRDAAGTKKLPAVYWDNLAELRALESRNLPSDSKRLLQIRLRIGAIETHAGLVDTGLKTFPENYLPGISLKSLQKVLGNTRTLVAFHLEDGTSYRWDTRTSSLRVLQLPPATTLNRLAVEFRDAVESSSPKSIELGQKLYSILFTGMDVDSTPATWVLALEGRLFDIPFAALVTTIENGRPRFLLEDHTLEIVPGAWALGAAEPRLAGGFLGIADAVYNRADSRFAPLTPPNPVPFMFFSALAGGGSNTAELPRLIGSGREVENCSRVWPLGSCLLTGIAATEARLRQALRQSPSVIHIAAHFVSSIEAPDTTIAFSLLPVESGSAPVLELLTSANIAALRVPGSLVVLSGCTSAGGKYLPGAGLLGLTRAWIAAGAIGVIASHWRTPDDSGELFARFYRYLRTDGAPNVRMKPAEALRQAQLDMLRSPDWRSSSRYWAAYQLTARSDVNQ